MYKKHVKEIFLNKIHFRLEAHAKKLPCEIKIIDILDEHYAHNQIVFLKDIFTPMKHIKYRFLNYVPRLIETKQLNNIRFDLMDSIDADNPNKIFEQDARKLWQAHMPSLLSDNKLIYILTMDLMQSHPLMISTQAERILERTLLEETKQKRYIFNIDWIPSYIRLESNYKFNLKK